MYDIALVTKMTYTNNVSYTNVYTNNVSYKGVYIVIAECTEL